MPRNKVQKRRELSSVQFRLELAREFPTCEEPNLARLLRYKAWLIKSGASAEEIRISENLISVLENPDTNEPPDIVSNNKTTAIMGEVSKSSGKMCETIFDTENPKSTLDPVTKDYNEVGKKRNELNISGIEKEEEEPLQTNNQSQSFLYKNQRLSEHLKRLSALASNASSSTVSMRTNDFNDDEDPFSTELIQLRQPKCIPGSYLHSLLPTEKEEDTALNNDADVRSSKTNIDDEIDMLTTKMERYNITPLSERRMPYCICTRDIKNTRCMSCGMIMAGRVFRRCQVHPRNSFPEDQLYCTGCCADVTELREIV